MKSKTVCCCQYCSKKRALQGQQLTTLNPAQHVNLQHVALDPDKVCAALVTCGCACFKINVAPDFKSDEAKLAEAFERLPYDENDKNKTRRRAYQKLVFHPWDGSLFVRPVSTYFQEPEFNAVDGGKPRHFAPLGDLAANPFLGAVVRDLFASIPLRAESLLAVWDVGVHLIRMEARAGLPALSSPPWLHKDGEPMTAIWVISRDGVKGGETTISKETTKDKAPVGILLNRVLEPGEAALVIDSEVYHGVAPIYVEDGRTEGHRDVILIEFTPFRQDFRPLALAK